MAFRELTSWNVPRALTLFTPTSPSPGLHMFTRVVPIPSTFRYSFYAPLTHSFLGYASVSPHRMGRFLGVSFLLPVYSRHETLLRLLLYHPWLISSRVFHTRPTARRYVGDELAYQYLVSILSRFRLALTPAYLTPPSHIDVLSFYLWHFRLFCKIGFGRFLTPLSFSCGC